MALSTMYTGKNNSPQTTITASINYDDTTIPVADASVFPAAPNLATIGSEDNAEVIRYNGISGNSLTNVERGFGSTIASAWASGTEISRQITKYDLDTIQDNIIYVVSVIATAFNTTAAYAIGDYVTYQGDLYRFTSAHSAGAWNSSEVALVSVASELKARYTKTESDTLLGAKAPLASPALTGTPTAPTAAPATNTTQLATCEYVHKRGLYTCSGTIPAGSTKTFSNANIKSTMKIPGDYARFSDPSKVTTAVNYTVADGSITFTGTFTGSVTIYFDLMEFDTISLT